MRNKIWGFAVLAVASVMAAAGTGAEAREPTVATQKTGGEATFGRKRQSDNTCRASIVCGKGYFISN